MDTLRHITSTSTDYVTPYGERPIANQLYPRTISQPVQKFRLKASRLQMAYASGHTNRLTDPFMFTGGRPTRRYRRDDNRSPCARSHFGTNYSLEQIVRPTHQMHRQRIACTGVRVKMFLLFLYSYRGTRQFRDVTFVYPTAIIVNPSTLYPISRVMRTCVRRSP